METELVICIYHRKYSSSKITYEQVARFKANYDMSKIYDYRSIFDTFKNLFNSSIKHELNHIKSCVLLMNSRSSMHGDLYSMKIGDTIFAWIDTATGWQVTELEELEVQYLPGQPV